MAYFHNIHSLADLKKEYRRLALQHHPDTVSYTHLDVYKRQVLNLVTGNLMNRRHVPDINKFLLSA